MFFCFVLFLLEKIKTCLQRIYLELGFTYPNCNFLSSFKHSKNVYKKKKKKKEKLFSNGDILPENKCYILHNSFQVNI